MGFLDDYIKNAQAQAQDTTGRYMYDLNHASDPAYTHINGDASQDPPITIDSEVAKANMSPEDKQRLLEAYKNQFGQLPGVDASYGSTPGTPRQLAGNTPDQMGLPRPTLDEARASSPQVSPVSALMGKLNGLQGNSGPSIQDILSKLNGPNPELQAAQNQRDRMQDLAMLGKSANMVLGGQTHTQPSNAVWDEMMKNAGQGISDIQNKNQMVSEGLKQQDMASKLADEATKNDPNSSVSKLYRDAIEKMVGGKPGSIPQNISAAALEKQFPAFEKIFAATEGAKERAARAADLKSYREASLGNRIDTSGQNTFSKETKDYTDRLENVGRFNKLVDEIRSGRLVDTHSISRTLTTDLSTLVNTTKTGGALTDRDEYALHTFQDLVSKIGQFAGKPVSAIPKEYLDQLDVEANALKKAILSSYDRKTNELINSTDVQGKKDIYKRRHDTFSNQYNQLPGGNTSQGNKQYDQDVLNYAKEHNITPDQAQNIKNQRTGQ